MKDDVRLHVHSNHILINVDTCSGFVVEVRKMKPGNFSHHCTRSNPYDALNFGENEIGNVLRLYGPSTMQLYYSVLPPLYQKKELWGATCMFMGPLHFVSQPL